MSSSNGFSAVTTNQKRAWKLCTFFKFAFQGSSLSRNFNFNYYPLYSKIIFTVNIFFSKSWPTRSRLCAFDTQVGHTQCMDDTQTPKMVFEGRLEGRRPAEKPWADSVEAEQHSSDFKIWACYRWVKIAGRRRSEMLAHNTTHLPKADETFWYGVLSLTWRWWWTLAIWGPGLLSNASRFRP